MAYQSIALRMRQAKRFGEDRQRTRVRSLPFVAFERGQGGHGDPSALRKSLLAQPST
jgi:hypothetical protein